MATDAKLCSSWLAGVCAALMLVPNAGAATVQFGSALQQAPNIPQGCETMPFPDPMSDTYLSLASNTPDCTWYQDPVVLAPAGDPRTGNVPGDGTITQVTVRSGANPAPLRFVVFSLQDADFGKAPVCCFFQTETQPVQPQANATTTFALNLPVQHNVTASGFARFDVVGVSAASGAGTLPLAATAAPSQAAAFQSGTQDASYFYPRMGAVPNDSAGGRPASGIISNVEVTVQWTWQSAAAPGGAPTPTPTPAPPAAVAPLAPTLATQLARIKRNVAQIPLTCAQTTTSCLGALDLLALNGAAAKKKKKTTTRAPVSYGHATYSIPAHGTTTIKVSLTSAAKKKLRSKRRLSAVLRLSPTGGAATTAPLSLKR